MLPRTRPRGGHLEGVLGPKKKHLIAAPEAPTSLRCDGCDPCLSFWSYAQETKQNQDWNPKVQKKADIAAATLSLSEAAVNWTYPPAKGVREPSGKGGRLQRPLLSCLSAHARLSQWPLTPWPADLRLDHCRHSCRPQVQQHCVSPLLALASWPLVRLEQHRQEVHCHDKPTRQGKLESHEPLPRLTNVSGSAVTTTSHCPRLCTGGQDESPQFQVSHQTRGIDCALRCSLPFQGLLHQIVGQRSTWTHSLGTLPET